MNTIRFSMIYKSREILCELLQERGYNVSDYENHSINDIHAMIKNEQMDMIVANDTGKKVYVKYLLDKSLRDNHIYETIKEIITDEHKIEPSDEILIVNKSLPNDTLKKTLNTIFFNEGIFINIMSLKMLQFNILHHDLVPEHKIVDKKDVYERYNISSDTELPQISRYDPVAICIGLRPKELCKIIRQSRTSIESEYYRLCVPH